MDAPPASSAKDTRYPFDLVTLQKALQDPPLERQLGVHVAHVIAAREGPASEVLAEQLAVPRELVLRLLWFGALYYSPVAPLPHPDRMAGLAPEQLDSIRAVRAAGLARWGRDSKLQTPRRLATDDVVAMGGYLRAHCHPKRFPVAHALSAQDWSARLLAVRPDHVVVSKPPGLQVPPTVDNVQESLLACVERALSLPGGVLQPAHRLDAGTEGVVVLVRDSPIFAAYFRGLMADKATSDRVRKTYRCLVLKPPPAHLFPPGAVMLDQSVQEGCGADVNSAQATFSSDRGAGETDSYGSDPKAGSDGRLVHWVLEDQRAAGEMAHTVVVEEGTAGAQRCELKLKQVARVRLSQQAAALWGLDTRADDEKPSASGSRAGPSAYEVTVELVTGRTHQVRVQMAAIGCPLVGDHLYGALVAQGRLMQHQVQQGQQRPQQQHAAAGITAAAAHGRQGRTGEETASRTSEAEAAGVQELARGVAAEWCRPALEQQLAPVALQAHSLEILEDGPMGAPPVVHCAGRPWWHRVD
ncbi:hypothetical protein HYH02_012922 [Chlamydomonas schloesseri]|uniref:Pseudouridine synthase RsuA/RluA-like domain-containing protein n=1 Tax=Chlamydomonas schloesseri TaxID=2026947 RepID=A0A835SYH5_9CHLO|nr:hypothetical protein HYH02_012922 [Chlamydomonas schloesseri]|eukprot:KAG2432348.1 hypothetical protein HYH02_012922 [Chlamydomonas schloesseri]